MEDTVDNLIQQIQNRWRTVASKKNWEIVDTQDRLAFFKHIVKQIKQDTRTPLSVKDMLKQMVANAYPTEQEWLSRAENVVNDAVKEIPTSVVSGILKSAQLCARIKYKVNENYKSICPVKKFVDLYEKHETDMQDWLSVAGCVDLNNIDQILQTVFAITTTLTPTITYETHDVSSKWIPHANYKHVIWETVKDELAFHWNLCCDHDEMMNVLLKKQETSPTTTTHNKGFNKRPIKKITVSSIVSASASIVKAELKSMAAIPWKTLKGVFQRQEYTTADLEEDKTIEQKEPAHSVVSSVYNFTSRKMHCLTFTRNAKASANALKVICHQSHLDSLQAKFSLAILFNRLIPYRQTDSDDASLVSLNVITGDLTTQMQYTQFLIFTAMQHAIIDGVSNYMTKLAETCSFGQHFAYGFQHVSISLREYALLDPLFCQLYYNCLVSQYIDNGTGSWNMVKWVLKSTIRGEFEFSGTHGHTTLPLMSLSKLAQEFQSQLSPYSKCISLVENQVNTLFAANEDNDLINFVAQTHLTWFNSTTNFKITPSNFQDAFQLRLKFEWADLNQYVRLQTIALSHQLNSQITQYNKNSAKQRILSMLALTGERRNVKFNSGEYTGHWDTERNGEGRMTYTDRTYSGYWKDGKYNGSGTLIKGNCKYAGNWQNGKREGYGVELDDNILYAGQWKDDKKHSVVSNKNPSQHVPDQVADSSLETLFKECVKNKYQFEIQVEGDKRTWFVGSWENGVKKKGRYKTLEKTYWVSSGDIRSSWTGVLENTIIMAGNFNVDQLITGAKIEDKKYEIGSFQDNMLVTGAKCTNDGKFNVEYGTWPNQIKRISCSNTFLACTENSISTLATTNEKTVYQNMFRFINKQGSLTEHYATARRLLNEFEMDI
jgi:hypothetical protein